jgi:hypothetical protein
LLKSHGKIHFVSNWFNGFENLFLSHLGKFKPQPVVWDDAEAVRSIQDVNCNSLVARLKPRNSQRLCPMNFGDSYPRTPAARVHSWI